MRISGVINLDELLKSGNNIYFFSDLHINHENILKLDSRSFADLGEMRRYIESEFDKKIVPGDYVFDLGDLFWSMEDRDCIEFLSHINTENLYKVWGNHDKQRQYIRKDGTISALGSRYRIMADTLEMQVRYNGNVSCFHLCHYPLLEWWQQYRGGFMVHGHTHGKMDEFNKSSNHLRVDISFNSEIVKNSGSFILSFQDILGYMKDKIGDTESFYGWAKEKYVCGKL